MPVAPGTDGGVGRPGANGHGFTRRVEWGGLAPMEPIVADTQRAAKLPGRGDRLGTLRPGSRRTGSPPPAIPRRTSAPRSPPSS